MSVQNIANALAHVSRDLRSRLITAINTAQVDRLAIVEKALEIAVGKVQCQPYQAPVAALGAVGNINLAGGVKRDGFNGARAKLVPTLQSLVCSEDGAVKEAAVDATLNIGACAAERERAPARNVLTASVACGVWRVGCTQDTLLAAGLC